MHLFRRIENVLDVIVSPLHWLQGLGAKIFPYRPPAMPQLVADRQGFTVWGGNEVDGPYSWTEVGRIVAFKRDRFTVDEICLQIDIGRRVQPLVISEDFGGYNGFVTAMEAYLPGVKKGWWSIVAFPAFAENATTIYVKTEAPLSL